MTSLPDPKRSSAVIIGASRFSHLEDIPSVRNNVRTLGWLLTENGFSGFRRERLSILLDPPDVQTVYRRLRDAANSTDDTLLIYFAGHGRIGGTQNDLYLCVSKTDPDELWCSAFPYEELRRVVRESPARKRLIILDCCFSGRAINDMSGLGAIHDQTIISGTYVLTATSANNVALAPDGETYTSFTDALLRVLYHGIDDGPEYLTCDLIYARVAKILTSRGLPKPRQQGSDTVSRLAFVRNAANSQAMSPIGKRPAAHRLSGEAPLRLARNTTVTTPSKAETRAPNRGNGTEDSFQDLLSPVTGGMRPDRAKTARQAFGPDTTPATNLHERARSQTSVSPLLPGPARPLAPARSSPAARVRKSLNSLPASATIRQNWWLAPAFVGFGLLTWITFLISAGLRGDPKRALIAIPYFAWTICFGVAAPTPQEESPAWLLVAFYFLWFMSFPHALYENRQWRLFKGDPEWSVLRAPSTEVRHVPLRASLNRGAWILLVALGLGWFSGLAFLTVGRRLPRLNLILGFALYSVWFVACMLLVGPGSAPIPTWLVIMILLVWLAAIVHAVLENRRILAGRYYVSPGDPAISIITDDTGGVSASSDPH